MVIDPYQPYATAVAQALPEARLVVDHFHVIRLANAALDEVRRRVQHTTLGHRGRKPDPLYRIRRRLLTGHEHLDPAGSARMLAWLEIGDPDGEVAACYLASIHRFGSGVGLWMDACSPESSRDCVWR